MNLSISLFIYPYIYLSIYFSIYWGNGMGNLGNPLRRCPLRQKVQYLSISIYLYVYLSIFLSIRLSIGRRPREISLIINEYLYAYLLYLSKFWLPSKDIYVYIYIIFNISRRSVCGRRYSGAKRRGLERPPNLPAPAWSPYLEGYQ